jgi:AcrR family transcriptional regulator
VAKQPLSRSVRRARTATKLVAGKSVPEIARETGVSRATAYRDASSPECQYRIAQVLDRRGQQLDELLEKMIQRISEALDADRLIIIGVGEGVQKLARPTDPNLRADHATRMKAASQLMRLYMLGRPVPRSEVADDKPITLEQFERLLQSFTRQTT